MSEHAAGFAGLMAPLSLLLFSLVHITATCVLLQQTALSSLRQRRRLLLQQRYVRGGDSSAAEERRRCGRWWYEEVPAMDATQFHENFRMSRQNVSYLCRLLAPSPAQPNPPFLRRISMELAVCLFLTRLGTKASCREVGNQFGRSRAFVCEVTTAVSRLIVGRLDKLIYTPQTADDWKAIAQRWAQRVSKPNSLMQNACGAIDCVHIRIWKPSFPDAIVYRNRKQFWSYNVQAVCDDRGLFISVVTNVPGSAHDAGILTRTSFFRLCAATIPTDYYLLADSGYQLLPWQLTPYKAMHDDRPFEPRQAVYNKAQASTRGIIERSFGKLKNRWRKLYGMEMRDQRYISYFIRSGFILHNFVEIREKAPTHWPELNPNFEDWPDVRE
jgi:hypothetical protein